ncbi:ABC transporter substrate-binding protein [Catenulispora subtropica]|uniref:ABC transporter substrate-binding protein n=1 Tax=Catenulispora subtropica TaxID=450798 RepID=A0ABN2R6B8_9ACTN
MDTKSGYVPAAVYPVRRRRRLFVVLAVASVASLPLSGCGHSAAKGAGVGAPSVSGKGDPSATVTIGIASDPGNLSPTTALAGTAIELNGFAYDRLIHIDPDGRVVPGVAESWTASSPSASSSAATFTIRPGVTCQDGSPLTAEDVAAEYNYIADPKNSSPMLGLTVPVTAKATADVAARTVTVTTSAPAPFIVEMTQLLPLVCRKSLADPAALAKTSNASGPYQLSEALPGDHYTYTKRAGYTWGPNGSNNAEMPATVVFKVVANASTAANMLLAGQLNIAQVNGPDTRRLESARVAKQSTLVPFGFAQFNEATVRPTADAAVRRALVEALDLKQIGSVATGGTGAPATTIGELAPNPCTGDSVTGNLPAHDLVKAAADLTAAGWAKSGSGWSKDGKALSITQVTSSALGPDASAAYELAAKQWSDFGVKVESKVVDATTVVTTLSGGAWDVAWIPVSVPLPDQLTRFYDGPAAPNGTNFGSIANPDYTALSKQAMAVAGKAGCALWEQADAALVKRVDVVPIVSNQVGYYGKGVAFQVDGSGPIPSTLRAS